MKKILILAISLILSFTLFGCTKTDQETSDFPEEDGRGDLIEEIIPEGADVIRQGVYYYELAEFSGDYGDGVSPRDGAVLADDLLDSMGFYSINGGVPADKCVYISLDELEFLDSAMGRECYIYSIGVGAPENGLMGEGYQVVYRISVDYGGEKTAVLYEDFSSDYTGDGQGDIIDSDSEKGRLTLVADFSNGNVDNQQKTKEIMLPSGNEMPASDALVAFHLADELSSWTGLDFYLNHVRIEGETATVDWSASSTLISGLGDKTQKEDFYFHDAVSLNWFMMDSLAQTLKQNFDITTVYYNTDGNDIYFTNQEDMAQQGLPFLPANQSYEGSAFFVGHSN